MFNAPRPRILAAAAAIAILGGSALPAMARESSNAEPKTRLTIEHRNGKTLYCATDAAVTGSRLPTTTCQTREAWAQDGLVIPQRESAADAPKRQQPAG